MKQLLCLSHTPWQARPDRTQQLLTRLTDIQILFFEPAPKSGAPAPGQGRRVRAHITVYTFPAPLPDPRDRSVLAQRRLEKCFDFLRRTMERHRFREPVLWCNHPEQAVFLDETAYRGLIYDCFRIWNDRWMDQESDLACHADVVFAASRELADRLSLCSGNIALLPNGVNPLLFSQRDLAVPSAISALSGKRLLCRVGDLTAQTELEPLIYAAQHRLEWQFILVGRYTNTVSARLKELENVHLLGPVGPLDVPEYLAPCDLLFDLLRRDQRGSGVISGRVYEYLACGRPIVTMAEPGLYEPFPDAVYTAYDDEGFLRWCGRALREEPSRAPIRREYARRASWTNRAAEAASILTVSGLF